MLNRFVGGMAIVRVRSRRKEHGRTNGSSVLYIANWPLANIAKVLSKDIKTWWSMPTRCNQ